MTVALNEKALTLFENNQYRDALRVFEEAVKVNRTVQSLNNLAWMYLYEEEDAQQAKMLLEEVVEMKPHSYFPYNMLGEIAIREKKWSFAIKALETSLSIHPSIEAIHNLALAHFYTSSYQKAAQGFHSIAKDSDIIQLYEVYALIQQNKMDAATTILDCWNDQSDDYCGAIEAADAYIETGNYESARLMFEREWDQYVLSPYIISRFAYTLFQLNDMETCKEIIDVAIEKKKEEILEEHEEPTEENWTEQDKSERIAELQVELKELQQLFTSIQTGFRPAMDVDIYATGSCYLFGCKQHGHENYSE